MTSSQESGRIPCVEEPQLKALDKDGDGVLSLEEIVSTFPDHPQVKQLTQMLEARGIAGIRYTGCEDTPEASGTTAADNGGGEDIARLIARAAVAQLYGGGNR